MEAGDLRTVLDDVARRRPLRLRVRPNPLHAATWAGAVPGLHAVTARRRAHVLDLEGGFDTVWRRRFTSGTRNNVRNAGRRGVTVECDATGRLVPVFHRLLRQSIDRWADQQHEPRLIARWRGGRRDPEPKFDALAAALGDAFRLWVAWYQGRPAAAIVVLQGRNAHYTRGAMDKTLAAESHANSLLHRFAIEDACGAGCRWYHMGESGGSEGLGRFKARFGAVAADYEEYAFEALPLTRADQAVRRAVKRVVGFRETPMPVPVPAPLSSPMTPPLTSR